jgi:phosphoribosylanthranilate isomerase
MRTRVKICGITREQDLAAAVEAGADAIGFVFYPKSPRFLSLERATELRRLVPAFVDVVTLFVNENPARVDEVLTAIQPDLLQFHGDETVEQCEMHGKRYLRAFRVGAPGLDTPESLLSVCRGFESASGWLFDSYHPGYGGSGKRFDRDLLAAVMAAKNARPIIISGGIKADNVQGFIAHAHPYAVDVSSGVELEPGIKSAQKIIEFVQAVGLSDNQHLAFDSVSKKQI